jgi:ribonuclease P protein component
LSTGHDRTEVVLVDDAATGARTGWRFGLVLPKKQAKRSVTRSLIRHLARAALQRHLVTWPAETLVQANVDGWVLRLKAPFDRHVFPSAASEALRGAVRQELDELWSRVVLKASGDARPRPLPPEPAAIGPQGGA